MKLACSFAHTGVTSAATERHAVDSGNDDAVFGFDPLEKSSDKGRAGSAVQGLIGLSRSQRLLEIRTSAETNPADAMIKGRALLFGVSFKTFKMFKMLRRTREHRTFLDARCDDADIASASNLTIIDRIY